MAGEWSWRRGEWQGMKPERSAGARSFERLCIFQRNLGLILKVLRSQRKQENGRSHLKDFPEIFLLQFGGWIGRKKDWR